jgi:hypothetical protein
VAQLEQVNALRDFFFARNLQGEEVGLRRQISNALGLTLILSPQIFLTNQKITIILVI